MKLIRVLLAILIIIFYFIAVRTFVSFYWADVLFDSADTALVNGHISDALDKINESVKLNPQEPIYYRWRAKVYLTATANQDETTVRNLKTVALKDLETAYNLNPSNLATIRNIVPLYYFLAAKDLTKSYSSENIDPLFLPAAKEFFARTANISSNDVGIFVLLAKYQNRLGITDQLKESVSRIQALRPDLFTWHESLRDINVAL